ncbi:MAG: transporter, partial [Verrucomicrobiota bacterium]
DLIWGAALIVGGAIVMVFAFNTLTDRPAEELILTKVQNSNATVADLENAGAWERLKLLNDGVDGEAEARNGPNLSGGKMHMVRPKEDSDIPWTALLIGLWIPNFFYWGLNQYIVQRTLGSKSLAEGQKGIVFAAGLKLIVPFIVVIPGILAFNLFSKDLHNSASDKNVAAVEKAVEGEVFSVDPDFTKLQPELAAKVLEINRAAAGADAAVEADDLGSRINLFAEKAVENGSKLTEIRSYDYDSAFPVLVRNLIKPHPLISWFVLAALSGAVISSLASMLNSASTIATMDLFSKFSGISDPPTLVKVGRVFVVIFVLIAAFVAPSLDNFESIFKFIQEFQGFISPGLIGVFIFGFFSPRTPRFFGWLGIALSICIYGGMLLWASDIAFLNRMAITLGAVLTLGVIITLIKPMHEPVEMPVNDKIELTTSKGARTMGFVVVIATICLYILFW